MAHGAGRDAGRAWMRTHYGVAVLRQSTMDYPFACRGAVKIAPNLESGVGKGVSPEGTFSLE